MWKYQVKRFKIQLRPYTTVKLMLKSLKNDLERFLTILTSTLQ